MPAPIGLTAAKTILKDALKQSMQDVFTGKGLTPTTAQLAEMDDLATKQADALYDFVSSAIIVYTSGLTNGGGAVTGTFVGELQ